MKSYINNPINRKIYNWSSLLSGFCNKESSKGILYGNKTASIKNSYLQQRKKNKQQIEEDQNEDTNFQSKDQLYFKGKKYSRDKFLTLFKSLKNHMVKKNIIFRRCMFNFDLINTLDALIPSFSQQKIIIDVRNNTLQYCWNYEEILRTLEMRNICVLI